MEALLAPDSEKMRELLRLAYLEAQRSPDRSTQNGALLVTQDLQSIVTSDHNRPMETYPMSTDWHWGRPQKYDFMEHAERNCIFDCAAKGIATKGLVLVCPWAPCTDCARAIGFAQLAALIYHQEAMDRTYQRVADGGRWKVNVERGVEMAASAVKMLPWSGVVDGRIQIRYDEKEILV